MKLVYLSIIFGLFSFGNLFGISAETNLEIYLTPEKQSYLEFQILIPGSTVEFALVENEGYAAAIEATFVLFMNEEIVKADKFIINSERVKSKTDLNFNLIDVKRYFTDFGEYKFEWVFKDLNKEGNKKTIEGEINLVEPLADPFFSFISLAESVQAAKTQTDFTKNGFDIVPNVISYYPSALKNLSFYAELYDFENKLDKEEYTLKYYILPTDKSSVDLSYLKKRFSKSKKIKPEKLNVIIDQFDISDLMSGNYFLHLELYDEEKLISSINEVFYRNNKKRVIAQNEIATNDIENSFVDSLDTDALRYYLGGILPLLTDNEYILIENSIAQSSDTTMKKVLYKFWVDQSGQALAGQSFKDYALILKQVELEYGTSLFKGYDTDRGRVFLKYGIPDDKLVVNNEPGAFPYEIWHYYSVDETNQSNCKFVFYNPDKVSNNYVLLHSQVRGEIRNDRWANELYNAFDASNNASDLDNTNVRGFYGARAIDYFNDNRVRGGNTRE